MCLVLNTDGEQSGEFRAMNSTYRPMIPISVVPSVAYKCQVTLEILKEQVLRLSNISVLYIVIFIAIVIPQA